MNILNLTGKPLAGTIEVPELLKIYDTSDPPDVIDWFAGVVSHYDMENGRWYDIKGVVFDHIPNSFREAIMWSFPYRNLTVYTLTPDGKSFEPVQKTLHPTV